MPKKNQPSFTTDTGWNPAPAMRILPSQVYSGTKSTCQNVQAVVATHLRDGSMFPLAGLNTRTSPQDGGE